MGRVYTGVGYLTKRPLTFNSDLPLGTALWAQRG